MVDPASIDSLPTMGGHGHASVQAERNFQPERNWVISHIDDIFKKHGNGGQRTSSYIEAQLFEKARTVDEYTSLSRRLLAQMLDMAIKRQVKTTEDGKTFHVTALSPKPFPQPSTPHDSSSSSSVTTVPLHGSTMSIKASMPAPRHVGVIRKAPDSAKKRIHSTQPVDTHLKRTTEWVNNECDSGMPVSARDPDDKLVLPCELTSAPAVVAHLDTVGVEVDGDEEMDTYEACYTFLVPKNCTINKICVHLSRESPTED